MTKTEKMVLLKPLEFLDDVVNHAAKAQKRVYAQAMEVEPGHHTNRLLQALQESAKRGIDTRLHVDWYSLLVTDGVFNYWPFVSRLFGRNRKKRLAQKRSWYAKLSGSGVTLTMTNPPSLLDRMFPMRGRNHMKIVIIDDTAWIGGVNFHDRNFTCEDVMIRITIPEITQEIAYIYRLVEDNSLTRDMKIACTETTSLLVDSGRINHSLILRHARELIEKATTSVFIISLLFPDADILHAVQKAVRRNRTVQIIIPVITRMVGMYAVVDFVNRFILMLQQVKIPLTMKDFPIHTKLVLIDESIVMIGSHNLSMRGVRMGTEEIALVSTDASLLAQVKTYKEQLLTKETL